MSLFDFIIGKTPTDINAMTPEDRARFRARQAMLASGDDPFQGIAAARQAMAQSAELDKALADKAAIAGIFKSGYKPAQSGEYSATLPDYQALSDSGFRVKGVAAGAKANPWDVIPALQQTKAPTPEGYDYGAVINRLAAAGRLDEAKALADLNKVRTGKDAKGFGTTITRNNVTYQLTDVPGQMVELGDGFDMPTRTIDAGGEIYVTPTKGSSRPIMTIKKGIDPTTIYTQGAQDQRQERGAQLDIMTAGAKRAAEAQADLEAGKSKKAQSSANLLPLIDQADNLLNSDTTGSYIGAAFDAGGRVAGYAPKGAQNTAKLKVLQSQIMLAQPRMEGPQSDKDVQLYRDMAGQIADPTVPVATRKAALAELKRLHQQYAGTASYPAANVSKPAPQRFGPKPGTIQNGYQFLGGDPNDRNSWAPVKGR